MNVQRLKRLTLANAVTAALICSASVNAQEQLVSAKFTQHNQQLLINSIIQEADETSAGVDLLNGVDMLPSECDILSVFPGTELYINNPPSELVGNWTAEDIEFAELHDELESEDDDNDDSGDNDDDDNDDDDEDDDDDDNDDDENDDDEQDSDTDESNTTDTEESLFLSVSFEGYLIFSKLVTQEGIPTCRSAFIGELDSDSYTPVTVQ